MATYTVHNYAQPKSSSYKDYMPEYTKYSYTKPSETYSDSNSPYADDIRNAQSQLALLDKNKPGAYSSAYTDRINALISNMANRKFSYDVNGDALYQQYKNQYMAQGKQAMQDTIGQAAAMTGGYGNSYAASVGNQAYQNYLGQLNDKIPELYQLALDRYNSEGTDMQNLYSMMANQEAQNYSEYRDKVADYQTNRSYYDTQLQNLRTMGQNLWGQNWNNYWNAMDRNDANYNNAVNTALSLLAQDWNNYQWAQEQTQHNYEQAVAEDQWNANFNENKRQYDQTYNYNKSKDENEKRIAELESQVKIGEFKSKLMSPSQLKGPRGNMHGYKSYQDYVEQMINRDSTLTPEQRMILMDEYGLI